MFPKGFAEFVTFCSGNYFIEIVIACDGALADLLLTKKLVALPNLLAFTYCVAPLELYYELCTCHRIVRIVIKVPKRLDATKLLASASHLLAHRGIRTECQQNSQAYVDKSLEFNAPPPPVRRFDGECRDSLMHLLRYRTAGAVYAAAAAETAPAALAQAKSQNLVFASSSFDGEAFSPHISNIHVMSIATRALTCLVAFARLE